MKARSSLLASAVVLAAVVAGCKKDPDLALVLFEVRVDKNVPSFTSIDFFVESGHDVPSVPHRTYHGSSTSFRFGYYMPAIKATSFVIHANASTGTCVGTGTLMITGPLAAGQTLDLPNGPNNVLNIIQPTANCSDGTDAGVGGAGGHGGSNSDASPDVPSGNAGSGGGSDPEAGTEPDSSVVVTGKQAIGKACGTKDDCDSGFCVDGVCCDKICTGLCQACSATFTGGMDGTCANVMPGASSRGACMDETTTKPCGHDGTCDGMGACRSVGSGQPCGQSTCTDAHTFQAAGKCDGAGVCTTPAKTDCGTYPCASTGCAKPCTTAADCPDPLGQYCSNGTCKVKKALGSTCMAAAECGSTFCSPDQVCCDKACAGACTACLKASTGQTDGMCAAVQLGQDPHNDCAVDTTGSCGKDGTCDGKGACHLTASGTSCGAASCSGTTFTPGKTCNGTGMCVPGGAAMDCGQNACTTSGCTTACKVDTDCGATAYCDKTTSKCTSKKGNGTACGVGNECTSGACVEGLCCNTACGGTCLSCLAAKTGGANGTCAFIKSGVPDSRCTASAQSTCGQDGNCNGSGACEKWSSSTVCAAATCSGGNYLAARTCSNGVCNPAAQTACGGAVCDATSGCRTTCATANDCTGNNYCDAVMKKCMPLKANGAACGTDATQCMSGLCVDGVCCNAQCNGQCQSCSTGTCTNVKTARTACGGSGSCAGSCTGASPGCTFPGSATSCGSTGCVDTSTAYVPGTCNGSGTCIGASTNKCGFVCVNNGCGGSCHPGDLQCSSTGVRQLCSSSGQYANNACPSGQVCSGAGSCGCPSGQTSCSGACVNTSTDQNNCGGCSKPCGTLHCVSGACVQCGSNADCGTGMTCDVGTHTCSCRNPDAANLIKTPGFDSATSTANAWDTFATWDLSDADGCGGSGSAKISASQIKQCVPVSPASAYFFGFKYKQVADGNVACQIGYFFNSDCTYQLPTPGGGLLDNVDSGPATNQWTQLAITLNPATNTHSIQVYCFALDNMAGNSWLDQIYLSITHNGF